ncbi:CHASE3 domain-containing protein, partial [Acinetobacter baumannii]
ADNNTWIAHTYQVISRSRESLNVLLDVETGVRGYVASKQELFLEPYRQSSDKVDALIDELKTLTADNAPEQARFENLKQLYKKQ